MRTNIEFGGFYGSVHEGLVEGAVEMYLADDDGNIDENYFSGSDWRGFNANYIKEYTQNLSEWIADEFDVTIAFKKLSLDSPKYYNFETDTIDADVTKREVVRLLAKFDNDIDFDAYLKDATKSYDGYMSFYDYDEAKANKNDIKIRYLLRYLCDKFNERDMYDYYDRNNSYERIV
jgi:hypothetical protein